MLTYGLLVPHPPAIIPAIGGASARLFEQTIGALLQLSARLKQHQPDTLIVLTPHAEILPDSFTIHVPQTSTFTADFGEFGASGESRNVRDDPREYPRDRVLTAQLIEAISAAGLRTTPSEDSKLDFGTSIPLHYLASGLPNVEIVSLGVSFAGSADHVRLGQSIREVADESGKKIVFIASAELSHKLTKSSEHGYHPAAAVWDQQIVADLRAGAFEAILNYDPFAMDEIGECGYRSIAALLGAFQNIPTKHEILSYEAPTGVGCAVGYFERSGV